MSDEEEDLDPSRPDVSDDSANAGAGRPESRSSRRSGASAAARARRIGGVRTGSTRRGAPSSTGAAPGPTVSETAAAEDGDAAAESEPADGDGSTPGAPSLVKSPPSADRAGAADTAVEDTAVEDTAVEDTEGTASTEDAPAEDTSEGAASARGPMPAWAQWAPAAILSLFAIAMVVVVVVAAHGIWYAQPSGQTARDRVLAAAKTCTARTNTYHYTSLAKDEAAGVACTTGKYTANYKKAFDRLIKPKAASVKASQTVQINAAGIESVSRSAWDVVVYGQTKITQSGADPRNDPFAAEVTMKLANGHWRISLIRLPSQTS